VELQEEVEAVAAEVAVLLAVEPEVWVQEVVMEDLEDFQIYQEVQNIMQEVVEVLLMMVIDQTEV
jgi:hypothetical protein